MNAKENNLLSKELEEIRKCCEAYRSETEDGSRICSKKCMYNIDSWCGWELALSKDPSNWCLYHIENLKEKTN